jgi:mannose-6-phosphate isomerase-like protein (cupin superfamily)
MITISEPPDVRTSLPTCASEALASSVLSSLGEPATLFSGPLLEAIAKEEGGCGLDVPTPRRAFQRPMAGPIFIGVTCDANVHESHHFHPHQAEIYCVVRGVVRMGTWLGRRQREFILKAGDVLLVPPGSCHHLQEWIEPGLVYVFRSPNDITGDAAKIQCDGSIHCNGNAVALKAA